MRSEWLGCMVLMCAANALAAPITVLKTETVVELAADGTWTTESTSVTRINEQAAVGPAGQARLTYSDSMQQLEVLEAYTTTRDGRRIDVPADRIITQQLPASAGAPTFSDYKAKAVVFPQVEVGATLTLRSRLKQTKPFFPGVYTLGMSYSRFVEFQDATLTVRAPAQRKLHVHARDVKGGSVQSTSPGMSEWRWTHGPSVAETPEPGSLLPDGISLGVLVSSLGNYAELADAYMAAAAPAAAVTPAVRALATQITEGITDRRAQAEAIYRWVSGEIRYVAIAMGAGGFVPHSADEVIAARYGDCKDKTTLLIALLAARDIVAVPALINTAPHFSVPEQPILAAFNHAIVYVPDFDLYLDGTVPMSPFDALPAALRARPTLVAGYARTKAAIRETPRLDPVRDRTVTVTRGTITADGSVTGTSYIEAYGAADAGLRTTLSVLPEQLRPQLGKSLLATGGRTGDVTTQFGDLKDFRQPRLISLDFTHPGVLPLPGPGALTGGVGIYGGSGARPFVSSIQQVERKLDFPCPVGTTEESLELKLPENMKISRLPDAATVNSPYGQFTTTHEVKEGTLITKQVLALTPPKVVCSAADFAQLKQFSSAIAGELRRQILYE